MTAAEPGTWLSCPGCQNPIEVRAPVVMRAEPSSPPSMESTAWAPDPRFDTLPPPFATASFQRQTPTISTTSSSARRLRQRGGWAPIAILAIFAGVANVTFVGTFLGPQDATAISLVWAFGFALALFVSAMTRSIMGREPNRPG